ncbi:MAG: S-layer homology domain-containing protein [Clostridia bacterium]|nr:S-layer homology domain-containing protein [Clostridia bacterium]
MKKRILGFVLALVMVFPVIINGALVSAVSSVEVFKDVKADSWFKASVDYVYNNGLMNGTSATRFEPDTKMSRAMLVTVLWRYEGSPSGYANNFKDIPSGTWYTDAVSWAGENGIVTGVAVGKFDPDGDITREQLTTIMYRYTQYMGCDVSASSSVSKFPDGSSVSSWAKKGMEWAIAEGIITGTKDIRGKTILAPFDNATRAEVATVLMRYCSNDLYIHSWDEGRKVSDPTCTEKGEIVYTCTDCYVEKHVAISALGHIKTQSSVTSQPTCISEGTRTFYCTRCNEWWTEPIPKADHTWKAATCTAPKTCSVCGKTSGSALGHNWKNATCTTPQTCTRCGATSGNALGHTDTPTCTRCGRNNRAAIISALMNDVEKNGGEIVFYSNDNGDETLWISTNYELVYEHLSYFSDFIGRIQIKIDDKDTIWYYYAIEDAKYGKIALVGDNNMKRSAFTKNTEYLNYSSVSNNFGDTEVARGTSATALKTTLKRLDSYLKYYYGFSVHALGYTNFNP